MIETQPIISALLTSEDSESVEASTASSSSEFDFETVSKTILKLTELAIFNPHSNIPGKLKEQHLLISLNSTFPSEVSPIVFEAWEKLVKIVLQLISPASGWPSNLPQIPENITPYVTEEACELLDTIQSEILSNNLELKTHSKFIAQTPCYILVENLIPRLLWYIARSSDDIMRLLTGVEARVVQTDERWSSGMLRLVAILTRDIEPSWSIDLATNQPPRSRLNSDTLIQSNDSYSCRYPIRSEKLIQQLKQKIQAVNPEIRNFTELTKIDFLEPGKKWQSGNIQLKFDLEFIPDSISPENRHYEGRNIANDFYILDADYLDFNTDIQPPRPLEDLSIFDFKFTITKPESFARYYQTIMQQKLANFMLESQVVDVARIQNIQSAEIKSSILDSLLEISEDEKQGNNLAEQTPNLKTESLISNVVTSACETANIFQQRAELSNTISLQPETLMADLTLKLLWNILRSSYEVMQLVGGVTAKVIQPRGVWETGTLSLVGIIQADASGSRCHIDVVTGQSRNSHTRLLMSKAIATSQESDLCKELIEVGTLAKHIIHELRETSPEIGLWMEGMGVELRSAIAHKADSPQTNWLSGTIKLSIGFEFLAEKPAYI